jgi:hypothetical protein
MSKEIEEIRARHVLYPPSRNARYSFITAYQDIATLLAEVDRMSLALQTIRDQGGDVVERWSSEIARRALEDKR